MLLKFQSLKARKRPEKLVEFHLGERSFAVDAEKVVEVAAAKSLVSVPAENGAVLGVVNVRGNVIPVGDIRPRLGLRVAEIGLFSRVIILDVEGLYVGLFADRVSNRLITPEESAWTTPSEAAGDGQPELRGVVHLDEQEIPVIDSERVFSPAEKSALENVTKSF